MDKKNIYMMNERMKKNAAKKKRMEVRWRFKLIGQKITKKIQKKGSDWKCTDK